MYLWIEEPKDFFSLLRPSLGAREPMLFGILTKRLFSSKLLRRGFSRRSGRGFSRVKFYEEGGLRAMGFEPISSAWKADNLALDLCPRLSYLLFGKTDGSQSVAQLVACSVWDRVVAGSSPVTLNQGYSL